MPFFTENEPPKAAFFVPIFIVFYQKNPYLCELNNTCFLLFIDNKAFNVPHLYHEISI